MLELAILCIRFGVMPGVTFKPSRLERSATRTVRQGTPFALYLSTPANEGSGQVLKDDFEAMLQKWFFLHLLLFLHLSSLIYLKIIERDKVKDSSRVSAPRRRT